MIKPLPIEVKTYAEIWEAVENDATGDSSFSVEIIHNHISIRLNMEIDPGTGLSKSWEYTSLQSFIPDAEDFEFTIRDADLVDQVMMFFSKGRIKTGFSGLDKRLVIRSNNANKIRQLFDHQEVRQFFAMAKGFRFGIFVRYINLDKQTKKVLELKINKAIDDPEVFQIFYSVFYTVLGIIVPN